MTAEFRSKQETYVADTCEPLKEAASNGKLELVARSRGKYPGPPLPISALDGVRSLGRWDALSDQDWGLDWHRNEGIEITYIARGRVMFGVDGKETELKGGEIAITRPWQIHRLGAPHVTASCVHWLILDTGVRRPNQTWVWPDWIILSNHDRQSLTTMLSQNEQPVWQVDNTIDHYFRLLSEAINVAPDQTSESHLKLFINGLLLGLTDLLKKHEPALDVRLCSSLRTVELFLENVKELPSNEWTIESMSAACGLRRSRFSHYCKQITNLTPNEFLNRCRISRASRILLERGDLSITDVALESGFGSSQYFATVFQQKTGCSPSKFRQSNGHRLQPMK